MNECEDCVLREAVHQYLDFLDRLVIEADLRSRTALADTEIGRMTTAWRALLAEHQPNNNGRCPHCSGWCRPRIFPCSVWTIAHDHLSISPGPAGCQNGSGLHSGPHLGAQLGTARRRQSKGDYED